MQPKRLRARNGRPSGADFPPAVTVLNGPATSEIAAKRQTDASPGDDLSHLSSSVRALSRSRAFLSFRSLAARQSARHVLHQLHEGIVKFAEPSAVRVFCIAQQA